MRTYSKGTFFYIKEQNDTVCKDCKILFGNQGCELSDEDLDTIKYMSNRRISIDSIAFNNQLDSFEKWITKINELNKKCPENYFQHAFYKQLQEVVEMANKILLPLKIVERFSCLDTEQPRLRVASLRLLPSSLMLTHIKILNSLFDKRSSRYRFTQNKINLRRYVNN